MAEEKKNKNQEIETHRLQAKAEPEKGANLEEKANKAQSGNLWPKTTLGSSSLRPETGNLSHRCYPNLSPVQLQVKSARQMSARTRPITLGVNLWHENHVQSVHMVCMLHTHSIS